MPGDETLQKFESESESESEDEEGIDNVPKVEVDPSKLTPLSPEVISKQVNVFHDSKLFLKLSELFCCRLR